MTSLGSFGTKKPSYDFDYFGTKIRVNPGLGELTFVRLAKLGEQIAGADEVTEAQAMDYLKATVGTVVHPDDFDTLWQLAEDNGQDYDDLTEMVKQIVSAVAERPTKRPSSSSAGRQRTGRKSAADSSSRVQHALEKRGRPDLAVFPYLVRTSA